MTSTAGGGGITVGMLIAQARRSARLTQEQLAEASGLSVRAISSIECGARCPRPFSLGRLADALGLSEAQRASLLELGDRRRRSGTVPPPEALSHPAVTGLVGRGVEMAALRDLVAGVGPALVVIDGEPGMGKSRLLTEAMALGTAAQVPVLAATCRRGADPYAPIVDAIADYALRRGPSIARDLAGCHGMHLLLPEVADLVEAGSASRGSAAQTLAGAQGQERRLIFTAVSRLLANLAGAGRVLLVLDDLHWCGDDAADLLAHIIREGKGRVRVAVAARVGHVARAGRLAACVADLARLGHLGRLRLDPLSTVESAQLVSAVAAAVAASLPGAGEPGHERRRRILRLAGGLPLFLVELTRAAVAEPSAARGDGVPASLRLAVIQQVASLPEPAPALLRQMAAFGRAVAIEHLAAGGLPLDELLDALDTSRRHGLVAETRAGFQFRFPLVRVLVAESLGATRARLWRLAATTAVS